MGKKVDRNGFWEIKNNPLTKEGVFLYLGKHIDSTGSKYGIDPNKLYNVYRPKSEIEKPSTLNSFEGVPFINEHDMLGEGCTPTDLKIIAGSVYNIHMDGNVMVGDFKIYSDEIKKLISSGKKELSLGYRASFKKKTGTFEGKPYDFIMYDIKGNHVALVDNGRCGSDVRIFDQAVVFDSLLEIPKMVITKEEMKSVLDGMDDATLAKVKEYFDSIKVMDKKDPDKSDKKEEDKKESDKDKKDCTDKSDKKDVKDKCEDKQDKCEDKKEDVKKDVKDVTDKADDVKVLDETAIRKDAAEQYAKAVKLHDELVPHIGEFVMDGMYTPQEIAAYACQKLKEKFNLDVNAGSELATLTGFLAGRKDNGNHVILDSADKKQNKVFDMKAAYLAK